MAELDHALKRFRLRIPCIVAGPFSGPEERRPCPALRAPPVHVQAQPAPPAHVQVQPEPRALPVRVPELPALLRRVRAPQVRGEPLLRVQARAQGLVRVRQRVPVLAPELGEWLQAQEHLSERERSASQEALVAHRGHREPPRAGPD